MDRSASTAPAAPEDIAPSGLDGIPCQRERGGSGAAIPETPEARAASVAVGAPARLRVPGRLRRLRPWRLLPTPTGTPFTFGYAAILTLTSLLAQYADPSLVADLHRHSSTDVAHLSQEPFLVLVASALWIAGGIASPYAIGFLLVLTALERRIGALRTAGVFLLGHVVATLATEVPVGFSVLAGHLPDSSLHRLDYGISFGVAASVGALAGLFRPWLRWLVLAGFGGMLVDDLIAFTDPMTNWGHLLALAIGVATWPLVRRWRRPASS
ncbi:rhomboid-like protein [Streptomyces sp. NPDC002855]|uniref:rhomboid-like protein n=1 Tax=Streptomyces sp. NPDC002855 TaxID=3154437 RepID=UPI003333AD88